MRRGPRLVVKLGLATLAGAVVTCGVAWGCVALAHSDRGLAQCYHNPRDDPAVFASSTHTGVIVVTGMGRPGTFRDRYPELVADYTGQVWWPAEAVTFNTPSESYATAAGWPCLGLMSWRTGQVEDLPEGFFVQDVHHWGIPLRDRRPGDFAPPVLPMRPLWPGFAINTLFAAGVLLGVFEGAAFTRQRLRVYRSRCPRCNYDRRSLADGTACPECGHLP
jgi:hypothetical protein